MSDAATNPTTDAARGDSAPAMTMDTFLAQWQGHRRLTRRTIEAFPEDLLYTHTIGGMRSFGEMATEVVRMTVPTLHGVRTDVWEVQEDPTTRDELLRAWDAGTDALDAEWALLPPERLQVTMTAFGQWTMTGIEILCYVLDNEIHHRGQGYVYLRSLGIEPPPFYER